MHDVGILIRQNREKKRSSQSRTVFSPELDRSSIGVCTPLVYSSIKQSVCTYSEGLPEHAGGWRPCSSYAPLAAMLGRNISAAETSPSGGRKERE